MKSDREGQGRLVRIRASDVALEGDLVLPARTGGVVLFAHGSGSSRHSPRNRRVARTLNEAGLGTLLIDLLTADEEVEDARTGTCASLSASWPTDWSARRTGSPAIPIPRACGSATSARVLGVGRR
jgi:putative phosphoribosyl transferase